ncbi:MAG: ABC transporter ATP-binding protein [Bacteroidetes bacterium]|nr:MAG: ABC transporter ATP-binding protein [Bacteroidota bacterium]
MLIELNDIRKQYPGQDKPVLNGISLKIPEGATLAIVGPSGSGKSTLLNLLGTLDQPTAGEVLMDKTPTSRLTSEELSHIRNRKVGFIFQTHLLLPQLTVLENVLLPVLPQGKTKQKQAMDTAKKLLNSVRLSDKINSFPGKMSVGECQRVAVVRSLINGPELLLADEPTGSLDQESAEKLGDMLMDLQKQFSFTLITVTHSRALARRMETMYTLVNGKISDH